MPFRVPDDDDTDVESVHPPSPPIRESKACRSLDHGPGELMSMPVSPYQELPKMVSLVVPPRMSSLPMATIRQISSMDAVDYNDDSGYNDEKEQSSSSIPWLETVEDVVKRIRKRNPFRNEEKSAEPEDQVSPTRIDDEEPQSALEVSLQALTNAALVLLEKPPKGNDDDDDFDEYDDDMKLEHDFGFPSLQPLDVQVVQDNKTVTYPTHFSPVSLPGAHHVPGPTSSSKLRPVAVAVDWTNHMSPPPPFQGTNGYEMVRPLHSSSQPYGRMGHPPSDVLADDSSVYSHFQPQPTQQRPGRGPRWMYMPSASTSSSQMAAMVNGNRYNNIDERHHRGNNEDDDDALNASTSAVIPPPPDGTSYRFRNISLVAPSFFGFSFQRSTASLLSRQSQTSAERPLEATVVREDVNVLTQAEPVLTTTSYSRNMPRTTNHYSRQQQQTRVSSSSREHRRSSSLEGTEILINPSAWSKSNRALPWLMVACLAILIVIILVLAIMLYHSTQSSSYRLDPNQTSSPSGNRTRTRPPMYTWRLIDDCGQILGTSVALSSDGGVLATAGSIAVNETTSGAFVNAYLMNGKQCMQLGDTIQVGVAAIHSLPIPPIALSADGYTLAVGTTSANNAGRGIAMYNFGNGSWSQWGEPITAWTSTNTSGDIWGWSVAMSSNGLRIATAMIERDGSNQSARGYVRVFQYNVEEQRWGPMGNAAYIVHSDETVDISAWSVHLSGDGKTLAVGAISLGTLRVQVYEWNQTDWYRMGTSFTGAYDLTTSGGDPVALSHDGLVLAYSLDGQVHVRRFNGTEWQRLGDAIYQDGLTTLSGVSLAFGDNGQRLAIGMPQAGDAGMIEIFECDDGQGKWIPIGNFTTAPFGDEYFGTRVALNAENGIIFAAGSENLGGDGSGHVLLFSSEEEGCS